MQTHAFFALAALVAAFPVLGRETVLEDTPTRLTLEIQVPAFHVGMEVGGAQVTADGFVNTIKSGAPDLPWYRFQVASGAAAPAVSVVPEQWVQLPLPQALAGVPRWVTPSNAQAYKDTLSFQEAGGPAPQISAAQYYRGMPLRTIGLSLGSYVPGSKTIRMMKRFRVQVTFSGARSSPDLRVGQWLRQAGIKNVQGGTYLVSLSVSKPLAKVASTSIIGSLGPSYLKIQIGDQQVDGLAEDGVYSISYATAIAMAPGQTGILAIRINNLRMFAGPKDTLPASLSNSLPPTLQEIPIKVVDVNGDGTFDAGDSIIFYAHGTSVWKPIPGTTGAVQWQFGSDPYSFYNYYYLDWSGNSLTDTLVIDTPHVTAAQTFTTAPHYLRAEHDVATGSCNPSNAFDNETGFDWYWYYKGLPCPYGQASLTLSGLLLQSSTVDTLKGYVRDTTWLGMFNYRGDPNGFGVWAGPSGSQWAPASNPPPSGAWYVQPAALVDSQLGLDSVEWGSEDPRFEGYTVRYTRTLDSSQNRIVFPAAEGKQVAYQISNGANLLCMRVDSGVGVHWISVQNVNGNGVFTDSVGVGEDVQYFLYRTPQNVNSSAVVLEEIRQDDGLIYNYNGGIDNYNGSIGPPQYVIVAPDALLSNALALWSYRQGSKSVPPNLSTAVVRTEDIYREWSGGRLSPMAIRDALQYILSQDASLHYVLLYGDGHYDYRNIINGSSNNPKPNYIPPFNWDDPNNSTNPLSSDDFYGVLGTASGDWKNPNALLDVALGRLSVQTPAQAENYFAKMQQYEDPATAGAWRGQVTLTADDATQVGNTDAIDPVCYNNPKACHTYDSEQFAEQILLQEPGIDMQKIYLFDYTANAVGQKPEAATDLITNLNQGTLLFSFFGHGAYNQLADEVLMQTNDALSRMRNANLAFMAAIFSCTVGRFDLLTDEGMLEQFVRQQNYGAIVGFGAGRESYPGPNTALGVDVAKGLFLPEIDSMPPEGVGDAVQGAKNIVGNDGTYNKEKYTLFGEPVIEIRRPGPTIRLDSAPTALAPLLCGTLKGRILGGSGSGNISVSIVGGDVKKDYPYLANTGGTIDTETALKPGPILFQRTVPYKDSTFSVSYFLPKEVPVGDTAKILMFAWDAVDPLENIHADTGLVVSGTEPPISSCTLQPSNVGPQITVTGCNINESGGANFPDQVKISLPYCLQIDVIDSSAGILSGDGPDEGTTIGVTGVLAPYHPTPSLDGLYHKSYQLTLENGELSAGTYQLTVSARDGFNNLSERQISLITSTDSALTFLKAFNAPNPVKKNGTTFYFSTTLPQDEAQVVTASGGLQAPNTNRITFDLRIFNQLGNMVREFQDAPATGTFWDGTDAWGQRLANGVYFYQVTGTWSVSNGAPGQQGVQQSQRNILVLSR